MYVLRIFPPMIPWLLWTELTWSPRKDMGNTNFSIHLPRSSFNRHATAQLVLRAVRSLDIDARVNERNDICVGPYKMSVSWLAKRIS